MGKGEVRESENLEAEGSEAESTLDNFCQCYLLEACPMACHSQRLIAQEINKVLSNKTNT